MEEESLLEEEESSGNSDVALGQHSTTGRHFISAESIHLYILHIQKDEEYNITQSCLHAGHALCTLVRERERVHFESASTAIPHIIPLGRYTCTESES